MLAAAAHRVWRRGRQVRLVVDKNGEMGEVREVRKGFDGEAVALAALKDAQWPVHAVYIDGVQIA